MKKRKKTSPKARANAELRRYLRYVEQVLYGGSPLGGTSLRAVLERLRANGPYSAHRPELIGTLQRALDVAIAADAMIIMRAKSFDLTQKDYESPWHKKTVEKKSAPRKKKA